MHYSLPRACICHQVVKSLAGTQAYGCPVHIFCMRPLSCLCMTELRSAALSMSLCRLASVLSHMCCLTGSRSEAYVASESLCDTWGAARTMVLRSTLNGAALRARRGSRSPPPPPPPLDSYNTPDTRGDGSGAARGWSSAMLEQARCSKRWQPEKLWWLSPTVC